MSSNQHVCIQCTHEQFHCGCRLTSSRIYGLDCTPGSNRHNGQKVDYVTQELFYPERQKNERWQHLEEKMVRPFSTI